MGAEKKNLISLIRVEVDSTSKDQCVVPASAVFRSGRVMTIVMQCG